MKITKLKANHVSDPLGFELDPLCLSWVVCDSESKRQTAAQVRVAFDPEFHNVCCDSGKSSEISSLCFCPELKLEPYTRYYWQVCVWGDGGDSAVSKTAFFETGKMKTPWSAKWITPNPDEEEHPLLRRSFVVPSPIAKARVYVCGLGLYELEINGQKAGEEYLTPGFHSYDFSLQYQTYDISKLLKQGENAVGAMLGNGWYKGRFGFDGGYTKLYGDKFALICEIRITLENGATLVIGTDENWKWKESPVLKSGIYDGEVYDARKETPGWSSPGTDEESWKPVSELDLGYDKLTARRSLPVVVKERKKPVSLIHTPKGESVLDFGQNMAGWVEFDCSMPSGKETVLQYGEVLQDGCFYNDNLRTAKAEYRYVSNGKERHVRPHFTYYGFRYVKVDGMESVDPSAFTACVVYSDLEKTGTIETSNELVNRLFLNALWGQKSNFLDVPTDCPQRDERMGWTGDAQIFCGTACFNMDTPAFYTKFMADLGNEQKVLGGSVPFVVPCIKPPEPINGIDIGKSQGSAAWGDAATVIPWTTYLFYGDRSLLEKQYPTMKAWVDYIKRQDDKDGSSRLWKTGFHLADWLALDNPDKDSPMGGTDMYFIASAYYYYSASLTAKAAKAIGNEEDAAFYQKLADEVKNAIQREYFTATGRIAIDTQTAMAVALFMNLVPEEFRKRLAADLRKKLEANKMYLNTGFVGTAYLCRALSGNGANDCAYTLFLNEDYPSWLYEVKLGATTVWERWNSILPDGKISGTGMNSLNHYAYGAIVEWMYREMCGLNPTDDAPGFKKVKICPRPDQRIRQVSMSYQSATGLYKIGWNYLDENTVSFDFEIPFDAQAFITLPQGGKVINGPTENENTEFKLETGKYHFDYQLN
ncbi:MAG TPA: family 78 glycoside hydrolase catalytic domain [Clostridia bacterium]|nr:family 78 glycoside hydrolase catalytic domain [Clostridia bacterium]